MLNSAELSIPRIQQEIFDSTYKDIWKVAPRRVPQCLPATFAPTLDRISRLFAIREVSASYTAVSMLKER